MKRWQIIYTKTIPITVWVDEEQTARNKAQMLLDAGYTVSIWEHTKTGTRLVLSQPT